jgi:hypothetical protein
VPFSIGAGAGIKPAKRGLNMVHCDELVLQLQAREDKQHHGVGHANEKRISEDTSMINTGELIMEASMAGLREGTLNQCVASLEKVSTVCVFNVIFPFGCSS